MLLAFTAKPEVLEVLMLSITFGNVAVEELVSVNSKKETAINECGLVVSEMLLLCSM
jgi:hypothetical protein